MPPPEDLPVHPIAAIFPMLPEEEIQALADDIKRNGLLHPITLDKDGQIVDGRNRYKACGIAGVKPRFETLNGQDLRAYIFGENVKRRHMPHGARAMAAVVAVLGSGCPVTGQLETTQLKLPNGQRKEMMDLSGAGRSVIDRAVAVYRYRPSRVAEVLRGGNLEQAYGEAMERVKAMTARERLIERLTADYPDLLGRYTRGEISLETARAAADLFDEHAEIAREIEAQKDDIKLREEEIGAMGLPPVEHPEPMEQLPPGETAGDVWNEIVGRLDFEALDANRSYLERLKVRSGLLSLIRRYTPEQMAEGLSMEDADYLASTMETVLRWCTATLALAEQRATYGKPKLVP